MPWLQPGARALRHPQGWAALSVVAVATSSHQAVGLSRQATPQMYFVQGQQALAGLWVPVQPGQGHVWVWVAV